jgi:hypothetical protein
MRSERVTGPVGSSHAGGNLYLDVAFGIIATILGGSVSFNILNIRESLLPSSVRPGDRSEESKLFIASVILRCMGAVFLLGGVSAVIAGVIGILK